MAYITRTDRKIMRAFGRGAQSVQFLNKKININDINHRYKSNLHSKFEVSKPKGVAYSVRTAGKNEFWHVFWAQSAQFLNYKKVTLYGINLHTNVTYVQNLRFLH